MKRSVKREKEENKGQHYGNIYIYRERKVIKVHCIINQTSRGTSLKVLIIHNHSSQNIKRKQPNTVIS